MFVSQPVLLAVGLKTAVRLSNYKAFYCFLPEVNSCFLTGEITRNTEHMLPLQYRCPHYGLERVNCLQLSSSLPLVCTYVCEVYFPFILPLHTHRVVLVPRVHVGIQDLEDWMDRKDQQETTGDRVPGDQK